MARRVVEEAAAVYQAFIIVRVVYLVVYIQGSAPRGVVLYEEAAADDVHAAPVVVARYEDASAVFVSTIGLSTLDGDAVHDGAFGIVVAALLGGIQIDGQYVGGVICP